MAGQRSGSSRRQQTTHLLPARAPRHGKGGWKEQGDVQAAGVAGSTEHQTQQAGRSANARRRQRPRRQRRWNSPGHLPAAYSPARHGTRHALHLATGPGAAREHLLTDASRGILYLHSLSPPIIHSDIKSPNLLVDHSWTVRVSDFNLSKLRPSELASVASHTTDRASNPIWQAPEVLRGERETAASDVFAFGMVMLELLTWRVPWADVGNFYRIAQFTMKGVRPEVPVLEKLRGLDRPSPAAYAAYCQLMRECWADDPWGRPSFDSIVPRLRDVASLA